MLVTSCGVFHFRGQGDAHVALFLSLPTLSTPSQIQIHQCMRQPL